MNLQLDGARALVGGASRGLGAAIALALAAEGARVAAVGRDEQRLSDTVTRTGGVAVVGDLTTADGPARVVEQAAERLGGIDLVVANTGGPPQGRFDQLDEAAWEQAVQGTLMAPLRLLRAALPHVRESDRGAVLLVLSSSVRTPIDGLMTSNVLRPGLAGFVRAVAGELAPGVRVNGISPGRFDTARVEELDAGRAEATGSTVAETRARFEAGIPAGRYGDPAELAHVAAFLLSPRASYVDGQVISVDGGSSRSAG